ncbi:MAG: 3-phosphoshikimate 1-carboxyvinyltransferase [Helicobacteraceae bacterium]|jgi:3-phosphoshikimate 1-carboxyvinyltransferase|nr:3-phosphoshikimate 1-carboxyvinyltransferase [Helicobacteraceae bacterium]
MKLFTAGRRLRPLNGSVDSLAGDKSISHRCAIFSLLSDRPSRISNFLEAEDTLHSLQIAKELGATVKSESGGVVIIPPKEIEEPRTILDCGNAGTAMRIYTGLLAARKGFFVLSGDRYLNNRPMKRVVDPLRSIGAEIYGREEGAFAPIAIHGRGDLSPFEFHSAISSAQVKTAMILAALGAKGKSSFSESFPSRDHTERMLLSMGAGIKSDGHKIAVAEMKSPLKPLEITVPSDPSSGFFFAAAAALTEGSNLLIRNVTLNPTRIEAYRILEKMGAKVDFIERENRYEPIGDIRVRHASLRAIDVSEKIPWLIDELPALAILFARAEGISSVTGASELRVKESDRIKSIVANLVKCGVNAKELSDGFTIEGQKQIRGTEVDSFGDHRVAMSFAIAALISDSEITVRDTKCVNTSFPNFAEIFSALCGDLKEREIAD